MELVDMVRILEREGSCPIDPDTPIPRLWLLEMANQI
jgi:hypothetical protein